MRLEIRTVINHSLSQITATHELNLKNPRSSEKKQKGIENQIWGQNPRFGSIGQIILKAPKKVTQLIGQVNVM